MSDLFTPLTPPPVRRCCPDCGVELERTLPRFSLSETPSSLFADNLLLDIYTCPRCGLIRIYSYDHRQKEEEAAKAQQAAKALFVGGGDMSNVPSTTLTEADMNNGSIGILDLMVKCGLAPSKKEARRLVEQGGVSVNEEKVSDVNASYTVGDLSGEGLMIKKGKKVFHRAQM